MTELMDKGNEQKEDFPVGSWEHPDAGGIVRRGEGVSEWFSGYVETIGEAPHCFAGHEFGCARLAVMEVYGLGFCEIHGEEAASAALEEVSFDLEEKEGPELSPHVEHALRLAMKSLPDPSEESFETALLKAFPLDKWARERVEAETFAYIKEPTAGFSPPYDTHLGDRRLVCRHMREAFERRATWLVEMLEKERETSAAQAAWALALEKEADLRKS